MINDYPLITIGMTCFNGARTFPRALKSARTQDWPNVEIIIVDDCSTDDSVAVIRKLIKGAKNIRLICHEKNGGFAVALNTIIDNARGDYIAFMDDDDESHPTRLTKQYHRLTEFEKAHPGKPVMCYCGLKVIPEDENSMNMKFIMAGVTHMNGMGNKPLEPHGVYLADTLFYGIKKKEYSFGHVATSSALSSKAVLKKFKYETGMRRDEDTEIAIRIGIAGGYCISVDESLINHYINDRQGKTYEVVHDSIVFMIEKHKNYLKSRWLYPAVIYYFRGVNHHYSRYIAERQLKEFALFVLYTSMACFLSPRLFLKPFYVFGNLMNKKR